MSILLDAKAGMVPRILNGCQNTNSGTLIGCEPNFCNVSGGGAPLTTG